MFIISLTYIKSSEEADKHMEPHMAWVAKGYESGMFVASGRKVPRTGGVLLALGERSQIEAFVAADPFAIHEIAAYDISEVAVTKTAPGLEALKG
jgi:uncharacterized protein YciI